MFFLENVLGEGYTSHQTVNSQLVWKKPKKTLNLHKEECE
jgi:hypothetical protein